MKAARVVVVLAVFFCSLVHAEGPPGVCSINAECDDGDPCTDNVCNQTTFVCEFPGTNCDDVDACTFDSCDTNGCRHDDIECNDYNVCTSDSCDSTYGCQYQDFICDDMDPCTTNGCDTETGCTYSAACDDHNACTDDTCPASGLCGHTQVVCDDHNFCTADSCSPSTGCSNVDNCDDDDACTLDFCTNPSLGCGHTFIECNDGNGCTDDFCDSIGGCLTQDISCDDQNPCTEDTCEPEQERCSYTPTTCDDGNPCTVESCDVATGCASAPPIDCDDHDACTADACNGLGGCTHTPLPSCAGPPDLDDFQCYKGQRPSVDRKGVSLTDQFGTSTVTVRRARRLCAPASQAGGDADAVDAAGHLTTYTTGRTTPRFVIENGVKVVNSLGEITVDLIRPDRLMVPTAKSLTGPPGPLTADLDHFKCYRVRNVPFRRKGVTVETQFGQVTVDIKRPRHLCAPANKNGEAPGADAHVLHLMCYDVRAASSATQRPHEVFTSNQFGDDHYDIVGLRELCVASFKNPGPCGNGTVDAPGETCDPPGAVCASDGRVCGQSCTCPAPACGDGIVNQASEECDDGDTDSGDGCSATCETEAPVCGNDVRQGIEECDGTDDGTCPGGCVNCECLVSPPCPPLWQTVTDPTAGDVCALPCAAGNSCPAPFSCFPNGFCAQPCGAAPICGGACPPAKDCAPSGAGGCACFFQN